MVDGASAAPRATGTTRRACAAALSRIASLWGLTLAACGLPARQSTLSPAASGSPATISLYSRTNEQEAFTTRVAQFHEQFPKITVEYSALPGDYPSVIRTHAAAGTLADVLYLQNLVF